MNKSLSSGAKGWVYGNLIGAPVVIAASIYAHSTLNLVLGVACFVLAALCLKRV